MCSNCVDPIRPGQMIRRVSDGTWVRFFHEVCPIDSETWLGPTTCSHGRPRPYQCTACIAEHERLRTADVEYRADHGWG